MLKTIRAAALALAVLAVPALAASPAAAAAQAAASSSCRAAKPFYWELGDSGAILASGTVGSGAPTRSTKVGIASASKLLYAAYVVENGLHPDDRQFLNLTSGYVNFGVCNTRQTVIGCERAGDNDKRTSAAINRFSYGGGHMQRLAAQQASTAGLTPAKLGTELSRVLGVPLTFERAQPAGGAVITPGAYADVLRKLMSGRLALGKRLGESPVCTNTTTCSSSIRSPDIPASWGYSLGHWVEAPDGDGAFSSAGAGGFYPWIEADRFRYGIVAPKRSSPWAAIQCGRAIRAAYAKG